MASGSGNNSASTNNHGGNNPLNRLSLKSAGKRNQESMSHSQPNGGWINGKGRNGAWEGVGRCRVVSL